MHAHRVLTVDLDGRVLSTNARIRRDDLDDRRQLL